MSHYSFCVLLDTPKRVDMYISTLFSEFSRSYTQKIIDDGDVKVNGIVVKKNVKLQPRDELLISIDIKPSHLLAENIVLDIVYEDENMLVINKDAPLNVHPVPGVDGHKGTLVNALLYHCSEALPTINGEERPGIVHRLDKETSGLIMIAKNNSMMQYLAKVIADRQIEKHYIAIVSGCLDDTFIKIESYIGRDPNNRQKMTSSAPINPKYALSYGEVLGYIDEKYTIIKMKIETGRTHQIRVHLASIGFPIIGDKVYGNKDINLLVEKEYGLKRQALHAYILKLTLYGQEKTFEGPIKSDMIDLLKDITL